MGRPRGFAAVALAAVMVAAAGLAACGAGTGTTRADPGRSPILPSSSWGWDAGASASPTGRHLDKGETPPSPGEGGGSTGSGDPLAGPVCSALDLARRALSDAVGNGGPSQATIRELSTVLQQLGTGAAAYATAGRSDVAVHIAQLVGALGRVEGAIAAGDAGAILQAGSDATRMIVAHFTGPNADVDCS
jgi:hypothetical protein